MALAGASSLILRFDAVISPQLAKLQQEREAHFGSDMTQIVLLALCSLFWDVFVLYCASTSLTVCSRVPPRHGV
eukprot:SAG11_NODE_1731_length_4363_cov_4.183865_2_plen_74_part_00